MSRVWYISDPHFYHKTISEVRGVSTEDNNEIICESWSKMVKPKDQVWVMGDITISKYDESLELIKKLPGRKHLISGNHDPVHPMHKTFHKYFPVWMEAFETISPYQKKKLIGKDVLLCHFPYIKTPGYKYEQYAMTDLGNILLHGHTHSTEVLDGNSINLCWEAWGKMIDQEEILEILWTL